MLTAFASQLQLRHSQNNLELLWSALDCITPCDLTLSLLDNVAWQANAHDLCTLSEARHLNGFMHVHFNETLWYVAIMETYQVFDPPESQHLDMCTLPQSQLRVHIRARVDPRLHILTQGV